MKNKKQEKLEQLSTVQFNLIFNLIKNNPQWRDIDFVNHIIQFEYIDENEPIAKVKGVVQAMKQRLNEEMGQQRLFD